MDKCSGAMRKLTDEELLTEINSARQLLERVPSSAVDSIIRQLDWGRQRLMGESVERRPGPFTMGIIAIRELDGFSEVSERLIRIQSELEAREPVVLLSEADKRRRRHEYKKRHT